MTSVNTKTYSFINGNANDASQVDAEFTTLFNNDQTLATALTSLENGNFKTATTLTLNSDYAGGAPGDMSFMVERGTLPNTGIRWNETTDLWEVTPDGTNYYPLGFQVGEIIAYAGSTAPTGTLPCDGTAVSRTTYSRLFAQIGTEHGAGDGSTTFNVPDLQGRSPMGAGSGSGLTSRTAGTKLGEENHVLSESEMPAHTHTTNAGGSQSVTSGGGFSPAFAGGTPTSSAGGSAAHNTIHPVTVVRYAIYY